MTQTAARNELGQTLEGVRRQAQRSVRELLGARVHIDHEDVLDHWNCCLDGEQAAEDWLRREGFEDIANMEFGPTSRAMGDPT